MAAKPYIQLMRNPDAETLLANYPNAFRLLTFVAFRARRKQEVCPFTNLKQNEARVGDYKKMGMSESNYRTAKKQLTKFGFATFEGTSQGSIATLLSSRVYNINPAAGHELDNGQVTNQLTGEQRTGNGRLTTKKNVKNLNNENNGEEGEEYPRLLLVLEKDLTIENAIAALRAGHPDFEKVPVINLQNSFKGQPARERWAGAIEGLVARYAGADLERPNQTLINWLQGKPSEKNSAAESDAHRLKLDF